MSATTGIEWTDATWNPVVGCSLASPGCTNCYAMTMAARIERMTAALDRKTPYAGLTRPSKAGPVWTGKVAVNWNNHDVPLRWRKPRRIFVNSMSDLFHEGLDVEEIAEIYGVAIAAVHLRGHTLQILTKRAARMREILHREDFWDIANSRAEAEVMERVDPLDRRKGDARATLKDYDPENPPPGIWLGVSAEDQARADERIPELLATPAAKRFVSCEPLLGAVDLTGLCDGWSFHDALAGLRYHDSPDPSPTHPEPRLDWVIVGGESGQGARAHWVPNTRAIVRQCRRTDVACYVKQMGGNVQDRNDAGFEGCDNDWCLDDAVDQVEHDIDGFADDAQGAPVRIRLRDRKGGDMAEWPADLRVRQFPA